MDISSFSGNNAYLFSDCKETKQAVNINE